MGRTLATTTGAPTAPLIVFADTSVPYGYGVKETENFPAQTMALLAPAKYDAVNVGNDGLTTFVTLGAS